MRVKIFLISGQIIEITMNSDELIKLQMQYRKRFLHQVNDDCDNLFDGKELTLDTREIAAIQSKEIDFSEI